MIYQIIWSVGLMDVGMNHRPNLQGLSKTVKGTPYLSSAINFKKNYLSNLFIPHPHLSKKDFDQIALDILWSGTFT